MNKKVLSCIMLIITLGISIFGIVNINDKKIYKNLKSTDTILNTNALTMMYETEAGSGEYQVSSESTWPQDGYVFNETLSSCENGGTLTWNSETNRVVMQANTSDKCYVYFDKEPSLAELCSGKTFSECITTEVYTGTDGANDLYLHDGVGTYGTLEAGDNSYRYTGANQNNYVCFGSDEETCPADNLYRIIGVFNEQVKLIKADFATSTSLGTDGDYSSNTYAASSYPNYEGSLTTINRYYTWSESQLNTVNLNTNYLNSIGSEWSELIATANWQVGGASYLQVMHNSTAKNAYVYEIGTNSTNTTYSAKIGLMYLNEYYYGATPTYWSYPGYTTSSYPDTDGNYGADYDYRAAINDNWMYLGVTEWTISRRSDDSIDAFIVGNSGNVTRNYVLGYIAVRQSFYLQSWVLYSSGNGTESNPYRISAPENLIEFTINDTTYYAEEGMTWGEWISSNYNIDGFYISENSTICSDTSNGSGCLNKVSANQTIIKDRTYSGTHQGGGIS